jgi:FkbM family methyltransferase
LTGLYALHPLGRRRPLPTVARLWAWQAWRRLGGSVEVQLDAVRLRCPSWSRMAGAWVSVGLHEPGEMMFTLRYLRPGDLFVDVGANIGVYSCLALGRSARVVAFEPTPSARAVLVDNLALNGAAFDVRDVALAEVAGTARFRSDLESSNHLFRGDEGSQEAATITVRVSRLDDELGAERAALIKVDAEGFDADVLRGGREVLARDRPPLLLEVWSGARDLREVLEPLAYAFYRYDFVEDAFEPMPATFSGHGYLIALPRERQDEVMARVRAAAAVEVPRPGVRWLSRTRSSS